MKTSRSFFLVGLVLIVIAVSVAYSAHTTASVRALERRLKNAEALLQSHGQSLADTAITARIRNLEERVQRAELAASQAEQVSSGGAKGLEQRIHYVEQKIKPHLETLPPYDPNK